MLLLLVDRVAAAAQPCSGATARLLGAAARCSGSPSTSSSSRRSCRCPRSSLFVWLCWRGEPSASRAAPRSPPPARCSPRSRCVVARVRLADARARPALRDRLDQRQRLELGLRLRRLGPDRQAARAPAQLLDETPRAAGRARGRRGPVRRAAAPRTARRDARRSTRRRERSGSSSTARSATARGSGRCCSRRSSSGSSRWPRCCAGACARRPAATASS